MTPSLVLKSWHDDSEETGFKSARMGRCRTVRRVLGVVRKERTGSGLLCWAAGGAQGWAQDGVSGA